MANEIICPYCGKSTPADSGVCLFCFASLPSESSGHPGQDSTPPLEPPSPISEPQDQNPENSQPPQEDAEDQEHIPEWLVRIRELAREENAWLVEEDLQPQAVEEAPPPEIEPEPLPGAPPAEEQEDWLSRIRKRKALFDGSGPDDNWYGEKLNWDAESPSDPNQLPADEIAPPPVAAEPPSEPETAAGQPAEAPQPQDVEIAPDQPSPGEEDQDFVTWLRSLEKKPDPDQPLFAEFSDSEGSAPIAETLDQLLAGQSIEPKPEIPPDLLAEDSAQPSGVGADDFDAPHGQPSEFPPAELISGQGQPEDVQSPALPNALLTREMDLSTAPPSSEDLSGSVAPVESPSSEPAQPGPETPPVEDSTGWLTDITPPMAPDQLPGESVVPGDIPLPDFDSPEGLADTDGSSTPPIPEWLEMHTDSGLSAGNLGLPASQDQAASPTAEVDTPLPSDEILSAYLHQPPYAAQSKLTDQQVEQVRILEQMVHGTPVFQAVTPAGSNLPSRILRLVLAFALFLAVLFPILFAPPTTATPWLTAGASVTAFDDQIESIDSAGTVLVAFDYEPGYSGEMRFAAKGVLQRLLHKQVNLAVVSTLPAGAVLGDSFLRQASAEYTLLNQAAQGLNPGNYINLGYLPGGIASLQELAVNPRSALQANLFEAGALSQPWNHPALTGIDQLDDFSAILVITDSLETGRAWVEQTDSSLTNTPLLMITSAQVAPLLNIYTTSNQVAGMLSGLHDGMAYERLAGTPGNAAAYWNAYRYGMLAMAGIVLAGLLLGIASSILIKEREDA